MYFGDGLGVGVGVGIPPPKNFLNGSLGRSSSSPLAAILPAPLVVLVVLPSFSWSDKSPPRVKLKVEVGADFGERKGLPNVFAQSVPLGDATRFIPNVAFQSVPLGDIRLTAEVG